MELDPVNSPDILELPKPQRANIYLQNYADLLLGQMISHQVSRNVFSKFIVAVMASIETNESQDPNVDANIPLTARAALSIAYAKREDMPLEDVQVGYDIDWVGQKRLVYSHLAENPPRHVSPYYNPDDALEMLEALEHGNYILT